MELALSQEVYEYLEELDEMNWSARGNVLKQYLRNTSIGTTVNSYIGLLHYYVKIISKQFSQFQTISNWGKTVSNKFQARFQHNTLPRLMRYIDIFDKYQYFKNINI